VTILPTLVINNVQYRGMDVRALQFSSQDETMPCRFSLNNLAFSGKLESTAVLKAICAGFKESTEPHVCLTPGQ
jgi:hypothetical protein